MPRLYVVVTWGRAQSKQRPIVRPRERLVQPAMQLLTVELSLFDLREDDGAHEYLAADRKLTFAMRA